MHGKENDFTKHNYLHICAGFSKGYIENKFYI